MKILGFFFIIIAVVCGVVAYNHSIVPKSEKLSQKITRLSQDIADDHDNMSRYLESTGNQNTSAYSKAKTDYNNAQSRANSKINEYSGEKSERERVMFISAGIGGVLLVIGLILIVVPTPKKD